MQNISHHIFFIWPIFCVHVFLRLSKCQLFEFCHRLNIYWFQFFVRLLIGNFLLKKVLNTSDMVFNWLNPSVLYISKTFNHVRNCYRCHCQCMLSILHCKISKKKNQHSFLPDNCYGVKTNARIKQDAIYKKAYSKQTSSVSTSMHLISVVVVALAVAAALIVITLLFIALFCSFAVNCWTVCCVQCILEIDQPVNTHIDNKATALKKCHRHHLNR